MKSFSPYEALGFCVTKSSEFSKTWAKMKINCIGQSGRVPKALVIGFLVNRIFLPDVSKNVLPSANWDGTVYPPTPSKPFYIVFIYLFLIVKNNPLQHNEYRPQPSAMEEKSK